MIFTIEQWHKHHNTGKEPIKVGERVKTTNQFTGGDELIGVVIGREVSKDYRVADFLEEKGFTIHELYTVKTDNGDIIPMWPEEIEVVSGNI